jgi:hypothetical protein
MEITFAVHASNVDLCVNACMPTSLTRRWLCGLIRPQSAASYRSQIANSLPSTSACHQQSFQDVDVFTRNGLTPGFRPQNASLCSPISSRSGKSLDSRHSTPLTSPLSHTNLYSETEQQQVETVQPAGSNGTQFTETKVDVLYESIVNRRPRAQSAQSLRSQSARNRLLSRGLPMSPSRLSSSTTNPTSAAASAAATVPNSGLTTASHSGAPSGVHTPQKVLHDDNRNQHEEAEEELRYKQALMRALEKSYLVRTPTCACSWTFCDVLSCCVCTYARVEGRVYLTFGCNLNVCVRVLAIIVSY